jgi:hypothetical protein
MTFRWPLGTSKSAFFPPSFIIKRRKQHSRSPIPRDIYRSLSQKYILSSGRTCEAPGYLLHRTENCISIFGPPSFRNIPDNNRVTGELALSVCDGRLLHCTRWLLRHLVLATIVLRGQLLVRRREGPSSVLVIAD